ncbi:MAG: ribosomal protein S18-alanine N-acetyltransferase [Gemmatimonadetes bacterium]|nr:ribosomal protein S18-alanine N-acetyltransferase [Gemmatimonadota bacterium]
MRQALPEDIGAVDVIERACFSDPWSHQALLEELERSTSHFLVAVVAAELGDERVVGYAIAHAAADEAEVANVAVSPSHRGQGVGAMLVRGVMDLVRGAGAFDCWLEVRASNTAARRLYTQLGFDDVGLRKRYYARPEEDAIVMRRSLRGA